ncbi:MAG: polynucleotide adenylyltransferase PcnB [Pseudomonadota bacterium]
MSIEPARIADHIIEPEHLDRNANTVVAQLNDAGFDAYLVGGCVRDLLCGKSPKDFDVATNATPEEVKGLFNRSRLVGRRFPIAHVRFGREIIEVSTFRKGEADEVETDRRGMIVQDRAFGTLSDDAFRRDFSINALYFDVAQHEIIDYVGGIEDIRDQRLRLIGDPATRLAEDPVRLLRAIRFAAKLGFSIDAEIMEHVEDCADRLEAIPGARLFDEFMKLFLSGYATRVWEQMREGPLARSLFPTCNPENPVILEAMNSTDNRIAADMPVTPGFLIAVILWDDLVRRLEQLPAEERDQKVYDSALDTLAVQQQHIAVPRRFGIFAREVWQLQPRLEERHPRFIKRILGNKRFRAAFDFLQLRAACDYTVGARADNLDELSAWWEEIQTLEPGEQKALIDALPSPGQRRRRRRKRKPRNATDLGPRPDLT